MNAIGARGGDVTIYRDQIEDVYKRIETPEKWWASGGYGNNDGAFCVMGAFRMSCRGRIRVSVDDIEEVVGLDDEFAQALGFSSRVAAFRFNDSHTHAEVLALLKAAIDRAPVRP